MKDTMLKILLISIAIVVDVLYHIFRKMFVETESESRQLEFF